MLIFFSCFQKMMTLMSKNNDLDQPLFITIKYFINKEMLKKPTEDLPQLKFIIFLLRISMYYLIL